MARKTKEEVERARMVRSLLIRWDEGETDGPRAVEQLKEIDPQSVDTLIEMLARLRKRESRIHLYIMASVFVGILLIVLLTALSASLGHPLPFGGLLAGCIAFFVPMVAVSMVLQSNATRALSLFEDIRAI